MSHPMLLFKVSFLPILSREKDKDGNNMAIGRWMVFATAPNMHFVGRVIEHFLPELAAEGFDIDETIPVPNGHIAWVVNIGMPGRRRSFAVTAASPEQAGSAIEELVAFDEKLTEYVKGGAFESKRIDMSREGVW